MVLRSYTVEPAEVLPVPVSLGYHRGSMKIAAPSALRTPTQTRAGKTKETPNVTASNDDLYI